MSGIRQEARPEGPPHAQAYAADRARQPRADPASSRHDRLAELAGAAREGLLALAVGTGLGVLGSLLNADVERLAGPKGRHNPVRAAVRHGTQPGKVTLAAAACGSTAPGCAAPTGPPSWLCPPGRCSPPPSCSTSCAGADAGQALHPPLPGRLEPVGSRVEQDATGTSKSAISRRFVAATERALAELLAADLSGLELVALMVDGVRVAEHCCVVALGITIDGTKVPLGLAEGATENATVIRDLLAGLRDRGLEVTRPILVVIDGAKALRRAVTDVFDHPVIQRCQLHKLRNVTDRLPAALASIVAKRMRRAYHHADALVAEADLEALARELDRSHPGAAASLREGLAETLTVIRLGVPPTLARTLRSTNSIESMIAICRDHAANVKRWQDGQMVLRWVAAGMGEATKQFRRVNGYLHLPALRAALEATITTVTPAKEDAA